MGIDFYTIACSMKTIFTLLNKNDMDAFSFLNTHDKDFRISIDPCYVSFAQMLEKYAEHIKNTPENERKKPGEFLSTDTLLVMMLNSFHCYPEALGVMEKYIEEVHKIPST